MAREFNIKTVTSTESITDLHVTVTTVFQDLLEDFTYTELLESESLFVLLSDANIVAEDENGDSITGSTITPAERESIANNTSNIANLQTFAVNLDSAESSVTRVFADGRTTFTVTHNLNTLDVKPRIFRLSNGRDMGWRIGRTGVNTVNVSRTGDVADGNFRILI